MTTRREALLALPLLCGALRARAQTTTPGAMRRIGFQLKQALQTFRGRIIDRCWVVRLDWYLLR